jgi:hypothetical protein
MDLDATSPRQRPPEQDRPADDRAERDREVRPRDRDEVIEAAGDAELLERHQRGFDDTAGINPDRGQARADPDSEARRDDD